MSLSSVRAWAPANIAWVKYMGKSDAASNWPANPSLSMTLDGLGTETRIAREACAEKLRWLPEPRVGMWVPDWGASDWGKIERQLERVWAEGAAIARGAGLPWSTQRPGLSFSTRNTFPTASGIASSASGMAAFTLAAFRMYCGASDGEWSRAWAAAPELQSAVAALSRQGSGSSCRSFGGPWVQWEGERTQNIPGPEEPWAHRVVLVESGPKQIPSTEAHARVKTSPLWEGRPDRARARLGRVKVALRAGDRARLAQETWEEFWEMHSLFHTSRPPFTYWVPRTLEVLRWLEPGVGDGACVVTMDAGANIHVTLPEADAARWDERFRQVFPSLRVLRDRPGPGARSEGVS